MITLENYIVWIDVFLFTFLAITLIFLLFFNHIFLQFITSTLMIIIGIAIFTFDFTKSYIFNMSEIKNLTAKTDNKIIATGLNLFFENRLFVELIYFSVILNFFFVVTSIIYLLVIRKTYVTTFSIFAIKQNWWKIFYVPLVVIFMGSYLTVVEPWIGQKNKNKIFFYSFLKAIKFKEIVPEDKINKNINELDNLFQKIDKKKGKAIENKRIIIRLMLKIKKDLHLKSSTTEILEKVSKELNEDKNFKNLMNKKNEDINDKDIDKCLSNKKINDKLDELLGDEKFWEKKDKAQKIIQKIKRDGIINLKNLIENKN